MFQVLELAPGRREQLLAQLDVVVHRAADVEEQQHLHLVVALRAHQQVEPAGVLGRGRDGAVKIQFLGRALAGEAAQAPQRHLDVARAQLHRVVEIAVLALLPDLDGGPVAGRLRPDADAFRVVAVRAEGAGAAGADPFRSAGVALLLLLQPLLELLHQLVPAERLQLGLLLGREVLLRQEAQPFLGDFCFQAGDLLHPLEVLAEGAVELVVIRLVLHQAGARDVIEVVYAMPGDVLLQGLQQREELLGRDREFRGLQVEEEVNQH